MKQLGIAVQYNGLASPLGVIRCYAHCYMHIVADQVSRNELPVDLTRRIDKIRKGFQPEQER